MSLKERVVALVEGLSRAGAHARRGLAERLLAGGLLAVAVAGAFLMPRLLVGPSLQRELGVGAPSMAVPPVVLAPALPAQKSQPQAAVGPQSQATRIAVVPSASTSQSTGQGHPATSPVASRPPAAQSPPQAQPQPPSQTQPTINALTPAPPASGSPTEHGKAVGHDLVVPGRANAAAHAGKSVGHGLRVPGATATHRAAPQPKPPKPQHEPKPPKSHPEHPRPQHAPAPEPGHEAEPHGHGSGHKL